MTIKLTGGDFGNDYMLVRCNLAQASDPIQISSDGKEWSGTQYQCADARHTSDGLTEIGRRIAARELELPEAEFDCEAEEVAPKISITADGVWAGDGIYRHGSIQDCAAILGGTQDEAERIYEEIEEGIEAGVESLVDGDVTYAWTIA